MVEMPHPHKLLITVKITPPKKYKAFLSQYETTTGLPTKLRFEMENIGKKRFPGGFFVDERLFAETAIAMRDVVTAGHITPKEIESLEPGDTIVIKGNWTARIPGPSRLVMNIKAKDKAKIDFYQIRTGTPQEEWYSVFYVVDRHQLDSTLLLEKLLKKR